MSRVAHRSTISCPHTTPPDPDHTCQHSYHTGYSQSSLPPMLFGLDRHQPVALHPVEDLYDENNETVLDWEGNPIRDYPFLPRYIASRPPAWLLEYWARTDPRLSYKDIKARMTTEPRSRPSENTLNMRREREVRGPLGLSCWNRRRGAVTRVEVERVERWSLEQLAYNTAMTIEYDTDGQPARLRSKALVGNGSGPGVTSIGQPTFPLDTFLRRGDTTHTPGQRLRETLALYTRLSGRARELGLDSWQLLPTDELPQGWNRINSINRFTYDYFLNQESEIGSSSAYDDQNWIATNCL